MKVSLSRKSEAQSRSMKSSERNRVLPKERLYRSCGWAVMGIVVSWCLGIVPVAAQMPQLKRPEEVPTEKPPAPPPKKLVNEPRALGLLQLNKTGKGTLIPIAIRIDGKFYDASIYKADPVPMALDVGTVYEVEKTGQSEGLFTVSGALHNQNPNSATPWLGAGAYVLNGAVVASNIHKAEDKPRGLDDNGSNDVPPRLTRGKDEGDQGSGASGGGGASQKTGTGSSAGSQSAGGNSGGNGPPTGTGSGASSASTGSASSDSSGGDDSGRPQLKRAGTSDSGNGGQGTGAQSTNASGQGTSSQPGSGSSSGPGGTASGAPGQSGPLATAQGRQGQSQNQAGQNQGSPNQSSSSQSGQNYYRPMLRRGKPTQSAPEDTPEELMRTTETGITKVGTGTVAATAKLPVELVPAVSDAGGPLPESFQFFWKQSEEEDRKKQMLELAADSVRGYLAALAKDTIPAKPAAAKAGAGHSASAHKAAAKVDPEFEDIEFRAFDVWRNNQPVMVLTAEADLAEKAGSSAAPNSSTERKTYYVTIAARTDIYGDLRKLYTGVTDKFHLDVTPKLELLDAIDADGDGRGELLFRETTDAGNGYLIYRPTGDTLWKMFDSLNE
jgi:hypothetical protein